MSFTWIFNSFFSTIIYFSSNSNTPFVDSNWLPRVFHHSNNAHITAPINHLNSHNFTLFLFGYPNYSTSLQSRPRHSIFVGYYTQQLIIWSPVYGYICDMVLIWCVTGILPSTYVSEIFGVLKLVAITLNTETEINSLLTYRGIPIMHLWFTILVIKIFTNAVLLYLTLSLCDAENNDNRVEVLQYLGLDDFKIRNYEKNMNNDLLKSETKNQENSAGYHNTGPFDSPENSVFFWIML